MAVLQSAVSSWRRRLLGPLLLLGVLASTVGAAQSDANPASLQQIPLRIAVSRISASLMDPNASDAQLLEVVSKMAKCGNQLGITDSEEMTAMALARAFGYDPIPGSGDALDALKTQLTESNLSYLAMRLFNLIPRSSDAVAAFVEHFTGRLGCISLAPFMVSAMFAEAERCTSSHVQFIKGVLAPRFDSVALGRPLGRLQAFRFTLLDPESASFDMRLNGMNEDPPSVLGKRDSRSAPFGTSRSNNEAKYPPASRSAYVGLLDQVPITLRSCYAQRPHCLLVVTDAYIDQIAADLPIFFQLGVRFKIDTRHLARLQSNMFRALAPFIVPDQVERVLFQLILLGYYDRAVEFLQFAQIRYQMAHSPRTRKDTSALRFYFIACHVAYRHGPRELLHALFAVPGAAALLHRSFVELAQARYDDVKWDVARDMLFALQKGFDKERNQYLGARQGFGPVEVNVAEVELDNHGFFQALNEYIQSQSGL